MRSIESLRAALRVARAGDRLRAAKERGQIRWLVAANNNDGAWTCTSSGLGLRWRIVKSWA